MALGKYNRVDNRRSAASYCSTVTIVVFVALCLVGVWMMTSSLVVPVEQNVDVGQESGSKSEVEVNERVSESGKQFEDNPGDLPVDATKGDSNEGGGDSQVEEKSEEKIEEKTEEVSKTESENGESKTDEGESNGNEGSDSEDREKKIEGDNEKKDDETSEGDSL